MGRTLWRNRLVWAGTALVAAQLILSLVGPWVVRVSPTDMDLAYLMAPPAPGHWMGTDTFGRDVFSRVIYGIRTSLAVGLGVALASTVAGVVLGLLAGFSGRANSLIMPVLDAMMAFPTLLLALGLVATFGPGTVNIVLALSVVYTPRTARIVRAAVLRLREEAYVEAARAAGASTVRILLAHVLPNAVAPVTVQATFILAYAILAEAGLGFVGVGIQPPTPSLGNILNEGRVVMRQAPWLVVAPGGVLFAMILGINLLGDGLRSVLDPRGTAVPGR